MYKKIRPLSSGRLAEEQEALARRVRVRKLVRENREVAKALREEVLNRRLATRRFLEESCKKLKVMSPGKKCLLLMHFDSGFSYAEIAALCETSEEAVAKRIGEIIREEDVMKKCLDEGENDGAIEATD